MSTTIYEKHLPIKHAIARETSANNLSTHISGVKFGLSKYVKENPQKLSLAVKPQKLSLADKVKCLLTNIRIKASVARESHMWSKVIKKIFK